MNPFLFWGLLIIAVIVEIVLCCKAKYHIWQFVGFMLVVLVHMMEDGFNAELALKLFVGIVGAQIIVDLLAWVISSTVKAVKKTLLSRKNT